MESPPSEYQPCPLQFYDFRQLDHKQHCPVYSTALENPDSGVAVDDVDTLASELMALQHSVQNRINLLENELTVLENWQVKRDYKKRKHSDTGETAPTTRFRPGEGHMSKKMKLDLSRVKRSKQAKVPQVETETATDVGRSELTVGSKVKGDAPDRFWASVEPYCADITDNELHMLQEGIRNYDEDDDLYHIPPIGTHYSRRWALEDLQSERDESSRISQLANPLSGNGENQWKEESDSLLKSGESLHHSIEKARYGPLTERLIAAFLEEPVPSRSSKPPPPSQRFNLPDSLPPVDALESRIREELIALGLFEPPEPKGGGDGIDEEEDEILEELKIKQAELRAMCEYNLKQRQTLHHLAKVEMRRQELKHQSKEADEEVVDWLRRITASRAKHKGISRKEKEAAWRTLEHRDMIQAKMAS